MSWVQGDSLGEVGRRCSGVRGLNPYDVAVQTESCYHSPNSQNREDQCFRVGHAGSTLLMLRCFLSYSETRVTVPRNRSSQVDAAPGSGDLEQISKGHTCSGFALDSYRIHLRPSRKQQLALNSRDLRSQIRLKRLGRNSRSSKAARGAW